MSSKNVAVTVHYTRLCDFLVENHFVAGNTSTYDVLEAIKLSDLSATTVPAAAENFASADRPSYYDVLARVIEMKKRSVIPSWLLMGWMCPTELRKWKKYLVCWEEGNRYLFDAAKQLIALVSVRLFLKERRSRSLQQSVIQAEAQLPELERTLIANTKSIKQSCTRWDIKCTNQQDVGAIEIIRNSIQCKYIANVTLAVQQLAKEVTKSQEELTTCLSYADAFLAEQQSSRSNSSSGAGNSSANCSGDPNNCSGSTTSGRYCSIWKWLIPLSTATEQATAAIVANPSLFRTQTFAPLLHLKGLLFRRIEESCGEVDLLLLLTPQDITRTTGHPSAQTLRHYFAIVASLITQLNSSEWIQLVSENIIENETQAVLAYNEENIRIKNQRMELKTHLDELAVSVTRAKEEVTRVRHMVVRLKGQIESSLARMTNGVPIHIQT